MKSKIPKNVLFIGFTTLAISVLIAVGPGLLYLCEVIAFGNEDHTFAPQWGEGLRVANKILAAHGLCPANSVCSENEVSIFVSGYAVRLSKGLQIEIYGTSDNTLLSELSQPFINEFKKTPEMQHLRIRAYADTHDEYLRLTPVAQLQNPTLLDTNMRK